MLVNESAAAAPLRVLLPPVTRRSLRAWWQAEGGYREVIRLAWPLFLSHGSSTVLQFTDRMFLTWFSPESLAASGPSGALAFTLQSLFIGLVGYAAAFVAQYTGAGKPRQACAAVWQALYLSVIAALLILLLEPVGAAVFRLAGHDAGVQALERSYFTIMVRGSFFFVAGSALSSYFIGKGLTRTVLWVSLVGVVLNIIMDYLLIFGVAGCPRLGIGGAALATVLAQAAAVLLGVVLFLREMRAGHAAGAWKFDLPLMGRLLRYGTASGVQFALDMVGWTVFLLLIGRLGMVALGASNLAFQLNTFAFFPIIGFGMAAATLVGQSLGKNAPELADRAVWSSLHLALIYTGTIAVLYLVIPDVMLAPFAAEADPAQFAPVRAMTIIMLRFVAAYCLFDVGNIVFASALKGAGDTLFVMLLSTSISVTLMLLPTYLWCVRPGGLGVYGAWGFLTVTVCVLSLSFLLRYLRGHWRNMRVIEREVI